jgi:hypothetical protein
MDAIRTFLACNLPSWYLLLYCRGCSYLIKIFMGRWPYTVYCLLEKKKQNSNRAEGVRVLSVLPKVKI